MAVSIPNISYDCQKRTLLKAPWLSKLATGEKEIAEVPGSVNLNG